MWLDNNILVEISQKDISVEINKTEVIVEVWARQWPAGAWASKSDYSYYHQQPTPSVSWTVNHNLWFYPNVLIEDSAWDTVLPNKIEHSWLNQTIIHFMWSMGWKAYFS